MNEKKQITLEQITKINNILSINGFTPCITPCGGFSYAINKKYNVCICIIASNLYYAPFKIEIQTYGTSGNDIKSIEIYRNVLLNSIILTKKIKTILTKKLIL